MKHIFIESSAPMRALPAHGLATVATITALAAVSALSACGGSGSGNGDDAAAAQATLVAQGQQIFRHETFGDEGHWSDTLRMHEVIASAVDPTTALSVGLKVDAEALPAAVVAGIRSGSINLHSPATTVALLKLNAVVGLKGTVETVNGMDKLASDMETSSPRASCA